MRDLAAAVVACAAFLFVLSLSGGAPAQSSGPPSTAPPSSEPVTPPVDKPRSGARGVGVSIDLGRLGASRKPDDDKRTIPWDQLPAAAHPFGDGVAGARPGVILFHPDRVGLRLDYDDSSAPTRAEIVLPRARDTTRTTLTPETRAPACAEAKRPCPEAAELEAIKAALAELQAERDALARDNDALRRDAAGARAQCESVRRECDERLEMASEEIARLREELAASAKRASQPGDGAKAIYIPMDVSHAEGREIVHAGWDIIRLYVEGGKIRLDNQVEKYIRDNPAIPADIKQWLRDHFGPIPSGGFDFGALPGGGALQDELTRLCEPPPSLAELKRLANRAGNGLGTSARILSISHRDATQRVTKSVGGQTEVQHVATVKESAFNIDLSAQCLWVYDRATKEVKKQVTATLSVQYTGKDGKTHEVKYTSQDPQFGWVTG